MPVCPYIYCRIAYDEELTACPVCGCPREKAGLNDPASLDRVAVEGLPTAIFDMHQILTASDRVLEVQLRAMERFRIARALLQSAPSQATSLWGDEQIREVALAHPDRFWISRFVDPREPDAVERLRAIAGSEARVVKLLPSAGYRADNPAFDGFWETMQDRGLVAMAHTGFITTRHKQEEARSGVFLSSAYADPLFFDLPARKFPRLTIILCHLGGAIWYEAGAQMVTQHDNVWGDVAGCGLFALKRLLRTGAAVDWSKLFWGNDSPPSAYPFNLRLHLAALREAGAEGLAPLLLYENGRRFGERFLA